MYRYIILFILSFALIGCNSTKITYQELDDSTSVTEEVNSSTEDDENDEESVLSDTRISITQTSITNNEVVIGNNVEILLYEGKISVGDSSFVTLYDLVFDSEITSTVSYDLEDIVDSAELNIDGQTFDGDIEADEIKFTSMASEIEAGADVTLTAVLSDSDDVNQGDTLVVDTIDQDKLVLEDSEGKDLLDSNISINESVFDTTIILNNNGNLKFSIVNDGEYAYEIDAVALAGESISLAEIEIEAIGEDSIVEEVIFSTAGDFSSTIVNPRFFFNENDILAGSGIVTYDSSLDLTYLTFENGFEFKESFGKMGGLLFSDTNSYTTDGGEASISLGRLNFKVESIKATGLDSNKEIVVDLSDSEISYPVNIVPALVTVSIEDELGDEDDSAVISFSVDYGDNEWYDQKLVGYYVQLMKEPDYNLTISNDDSDEIVTVMSSEIDFSVFKNLTDISDIELLTIKDGYEWEFKVDNEGSLSIAAHGLIYWVDLNNDKDTTYPITNDENINLGEYGID